MKRPLHSNLRTSHEWRRSLKLEEATARYDMSPEPPDIQLMNTHGFCSLLEFACNGACPMVVCWVKRSKHFALFHLSPKTWPPSKSDGSPIVVERMGKVSLSVKQSHSP